MSAGVFLEWFAPEDRHAAYSTALAYGRLLASLTPGRFVTVRPYSGGLGLFVVEGSK